MKWNGTNKCVHDEIFITLIKCNKMITVLAIASNGRKVWNGAIISVIKQELKVKAIKKKKNKRKV